MNHPFLLIFPLLFTTTVPFLFPFSSGSNCGCSCAPPPPSTCSTPAPCPPIMTCQPPPQPQQVATCCSTCGTCNAKNARRRRQARVLSNATYVADCENVKRRVKRENDNENENENENVNTEDKEHENETFQPISNTKCNAEELRRIIKSKIDRVTAIAKRRIQEEAESTMGGRFNVICARGDFSYVANTELFCQHSVGDVTCFLFKQLSDVIRRRLM
uniref:Ground-like domain-containing protein n=1 Tax=Caenorhabditis japonica TaxID=281687 RepID=A0A8R1E212_CAEJA